MIKLIATDMDGTLLDEKGNLPEGFFDIFHKLKENGIKFVVASGRPYYTLYENFKPISDELYYICDNGSCIAEENKKPKVDVMDKKQIEEIVKLCEDIPNTTLILCGVKGAYHKPCDDSFLNEINKYYIKKYIVDDLLNIDDDIFKITVCDLSISANNSYPIINEKFGEELKVVVSGELWVDINNKGVNKGYALEQIQKDENISFEETMVFGDFYNDIEMLQKAYYSFVMENANEDMKQYGNFIAKSNRENGVIQAINQYIFNKI